MKQFMEMFLNTFRNEDGTLNEAKIGEMMKNCGCSCDCAKPEDGEKKAPETKQGKDENASGCC